MCVYDHVRSSLSSVGQYHQWFRFTIKRRTQDFPAEGFIAAAQSEVSKRLSPSGK